MPNNSDAFFAGLYDGVSEQDSMIKSAEAFMTGLVDGVEADEAEATIMDKIAAAISEVDDDVEGELEEEYEEDLTPAQQIIQRLIGADS